MRGWQALLCGALRSTVISAMVPPSAVNVSGKGSLDISAMSGGTIQLGFTQ